MKNVFLNSVSKKTLQNQKYFFSRYFNFERRFYKKNLQKPILVKLKLLLFLLIIILSCTDKKEQQPDCNAKNPFEMEWIQNWIADLQYCNCTISIFQASYNDQTVFWQFLTDPLCLTVFENISVFDCSGQEILLLKDFDSFSDFKQNTSNPRIIYSCKKL